MNLDMIHKYCLSNVFYLIFLATSRWDICVLFTTPKRNPTQIQVRLSRLHKRFYKVDLTELLDKLTSEHDSYSLLKKLDKKIKSNWTFKERASSKIDHPKLTK